MADWMAIGVSAAASSALTLTLAYVAFRVGFEKRLAKIEAALENDHPARLRERISELESQAKILAPVKVIVERFGIEAAENAFRGKRK